MLGTWYSWFTLKLSMWTTRLYKKVLMSLLLDRVARFSMPFLVTLSSATRFTLPYIRVNSLSCRTSKSIYFLSSSSLHLCSRWTSNNIISSLQCYFSVYPVALFPFHDFLVPIVVLLGSIISFVCGLVAPFFHFCHIWLRLLLELQELVHQMRTCQCMTLGLPDWWKGRMVLLFRPSFQSGSALVGRLSFCSISMECISTPF